MPAGKHLLKANKIHVEEANLDKEDIAEIIRQKPNFKTVGIKAKLLAYNMVDSVTVAKKRTKKNIQLRVKNKKRIERQLKGRIHISVSSLFCFNFALC